MRTLQSLLLVCAATMPGVALAGVLPANWNPKAEGDKVLARLVTVTAPQVKGAHDAEMTMVGERAFVVAEVNDVKASESASWPEIYAAMSVVNLTSLKVERIIPFAKSEQAFANETLPLGACFVPRILKMNERTLRCLFASEQPGKRQAQTYYRDFDVGTMAFEPSIHRMKIKTAAGTFDLQPQPLHADAARLGFANPARDFGLYLFDSFKEFDGRTYIAVNNYPGAQQALGVLNDARDTVEILGHFNGPGGPRLTEPAVNRLPDGSWMAICRQESGSRNYWFTTSEDGRTWTTGGERDFVQKGTSSKPTFDRFNGVYHLGWQEATRVANVNRSVFNVDVSTDGVHWERKYRFETEKSFQYPTFRQHQGMVWVCVTQGDRGPSRKERIGFGKLVEAK